MPLTQRALLWLPLNTAGDACFSLLRIRCFSRSPPREPTYYFFPHVGPPTKPGLLIPAPLCRYASKYIVGLHRSQDPPKN